ncbi:hypothetical protein TA3x_002211 [Tundrisphaera sp. TA3]|uniref:hypothetical protein n=1 Tax=Tundrisphaera sp. TA3 TaxID=3435775 RepID=UPI003EBBCE72
MSIGYWKHAIVAATLATAFAGCADNRETSGTGKSDREAAESTNKGVDSAPGTGATGSPSGSGAAPGH